MGAGPASVWSTLRPRARLVGRATAAGMAVGGVALLVALSLGGLDFAASKTFSVGALVFGFGLLGWSGSILFGDGFTAMQRHLDVSQGWSERRSRRAMARIGGFGAGWMIGTSIVSAVLA